MKIFFFGGTFNPPHLGHKMIVDKCIKMCDKLILFPNFISPDKNHLGVTKPIHRIEMLNILFKNYTLEIDDFETKFKTKSYTYNTIKYLKKKFANSDLTMVVGGDHLLNFKNWYKSDEILMNVNILCFNRNKSFDQRNDLYQNKNIHIVEDFDYNISSSEIRENKLNINKNKFLSKEIIEYIIKNKLYEY